MANEERPLTNEERAELEQLRAEKVAREERAELERLRAEQVREHSVPSAEELAAKERARKIMEPGDDLSMPIAQRIVLIALAIIVIAVIAVYLFARR